MLLSAIKQVAKMAAPDNRVNGLDGKTEEDLTNRQALLDILPLAEGLFNKTDVLRVLQLS